MALSVSVYCCKCLYLYQYPNLNPKKKKGGNARTDTDSSSNSAITQVHKWSQLKTYKGLFYKSINISIFFVVVVHTDMRYFLTNIISSISQNVNKLYLHSVTSLMHIWSILNIQSAKHNHYITFYIKFFCNDKAISSQIIIIIICHYWLMSISRSVWASFTKQSIRSQTGKCAVTVKQSVYAHPGYLPSAVPDNTQLISHSIHQGPFSEVSAIFISSVFNYIMKSRLHTRMHAHIHTHALCYIFSN